MENITAEQKNTAMFLNLVITFQQAAYQHMGKIPNPITGTIEREIEQARMAIDMLDMLKTRTSGNLSPEETRMLDHVLRELKLNFVDELDRDKKAAQAPVHDATNHTASQVHEDAQQNTK
jgi:hypothetical protein